MSLTNTSNTLNLKQQQTLYWLEIKTELLKTFREPSFVIPSLSFAVMFYAFFALIFNQNPEMPAYLLATYAVFGIIGPALFSFGVGVAIERQQGWIALKQISPMPISAYFTAKVAASMVFACIILLMMCTLASLFGGVKMSLGQWALTFLIPLIACIPFCVIGLYLGLVLSANAAPAVVNLIYLPMAFLSGLWIPISVMPAFMEWIAWTLPAFHVAQLTLAVQGSDLGYPWWAHAGILVLTTVIFAVLARRAFQRMAI
uniref:ABC transporter permease n=1 Tax=Ningiella ruwaisensis TaxID=2364274 RepID=UPI0010A07C84|nr:ABC transporter permease [Ningiella ruwaisensis]